MAPQLNVKLQTLATTANQRHKMSQQQRKIIVGLYGVSGAGKSRLARELKEAGEDEHFTFYEGSESIDKITPGGLKHFQTLNEASKAVLRAAAIQSIEQDCVLQEKHAFVTGHCSFWSACERKATPAYTTEDLETYTHIIYLCPAPDVVYRQCSRDATRQRPGLCIDDIKAWQEYEIATLRSICPKHGVQLMIVRDQRFALAHIRRHLFAFRMHDEARDWELVKSSLDQLHEKRIQHNTTLLLDADRTLAPIDTGAQFWTNFKSLKPEIAESDLLKTLFSGPLGYSWAAFRQAMLLYEEAATAVDFEAICDDISQHIQLYPELVQFINTCHAANIEVIVLTCGIVDIWKKVLIRAGLGNIVSVLGGCRLHDDYVMTPQLKGEVVTYLKQAHRQTVYAIGDSPLDMHMLKRADKAAVVVGETSARSQTMNVVLADAIAKDGLTIQQILLPATTPPRLDQSRLPTTTLNAFLKFDVAEKKHQLVIDRQVVHYTELGAAKVLMTDTRNSDFHGPQLRKAHNQIGRYLGLGLADFAGIEAYDIPHVQGGTTRGFRLLDEDKTTIVALMRGGEPLASGVNNVFPKAMFVHANGPGDLLEWHVKGQSSILLVDSVINTGRSIDEMVDRVRVFSSTTRIFIVAGVVQRNALSRDGIMYNILAKDEKMMLVALRLSDNKFTGRGTTDTGNRLFNTIQHD